VRHGTARSLDELEHDADHADALRSDRTGQEEVRVLCRRRD
jgi:hypothetical protein